MELGSMKMENSTAIVDDMRIPIFFPIQKVSSRSAIAKEFKKNNNQLTRESRWGTVTVRNRILTQHHSDVLYAAIAVSTRTSRFSSGALGIYFSLYNVSKVLNLKWGTATSNQLEEVIREIRDVIIIKHDKDGSNKDYEILKGVSYSSVHKTWRILFHEQFVKVFESSLTLNHSLRITEIASIRGEGNGLIKSIINHCITQEIKNNKIYNINLDKILYILSYSLSLVPTDSNLKSAKRYISKFKKELANFGITYDRKTKNLAYIGTKGIRFISKAS